MNATPSICPIARAESNAAARIERAQSNHEAAATLLANEFINAMRAPDLTKVMVSTPGYADQIGGRPTMSLVDLMGDLFAGRDGDAVLAELLGIAAAAAKGEQVQFRAMRWIAAQAGAHAEWHAEDLARGWDA